MKPSWLRTGLVAVGLLVGCGKSGSHHRSDTDGAGGADDHVSAAGDTSRSGAGASTVGNGSSAGAGAGGSSPHGNGGGEIGLGGAGGEEASPPLALPVGCQPRAPIETANTCSLAVDCDAAPSLRTYCYRLDSGEWECQCANQDDIYRVAKVAGLDACALAVRLCSSDALELGEETCERASESSDDDSCAIDVACGKPVDIADVSGAQARLMRFDAARCTRFDSSQDFTCTCLSEAKEFRTHTLRADSGELACGPFSDFCVAGAIPVFEGEETCTEMYFSSEADTCHRAAACGPELPLSDDVSLLQREERFASCAARPGGGSDCECSGQDAVFSFYVAAAPDDATCESGVQNCALGAVRKSTGPARCEPAASDTSGDDMCTALFDCDQDATIDGRSLVAKARLQLLCRRVEAGTPWKCSCGAGSDPAVFELGVPGATAAQACAQAPAACLDRLGGLPLVPITDFVSLPDPIYE